jgi:hypothetical protein
MRHSFWPGPTARGGSLVTGNSGEAAASVEQSSEEHGRMGEGKNWSGRRLPQ